MDNKGNQFFRLKYRLPINHSINSKEEMHHHIIEIVLDTDLGEAFEDFTKLNDVEKCMGECLGKYKNQYINDIEEFENNATIENMGEVFFKVLNDEFEKRDWLIRRFEISETPLRTYAIVRK